MGDKLITFFGSELTLFSLVFFLLGCIVGSFLNVVIHRLPREMSILHPPSHCPQCGYSIPWYRNLPLITWLWQRGKCAECRKPIPIRYFLVELLTGVWLMKIGTSPTKPSLTGTNLGTMCSFMNPDPSPIRLKAALLSMKAVRR